MKSLSRAIRFAPFLLAVFLAIQTSPLWASTTPVKGIDIVVKRTPSPALVGATTDANGNFSIPLGSAGTYQVTALGSAGTYQVTALGGKVLSTGASVKLTFSVQSLKPGAANARQAPVSKTAVLDASGGLAFPGDIQLSEASVLTGHLEVVGTPAPAKE